MSALSILILAAALAASPAAAPTADYRVVGEDERAISLIEGAIKTDSDGRRETVFYIGFAEPISGPGGTQVVSATILFDCEANKYKVGVASTFKADMSLVETGTTQHGWRDVIAESPFSRAAAYACKRGDLPRSDGPNVKGIVAGYLARRAAATPAPAPEAPAAPSN